MNIKHLDLKQIKKFGNGSHIIFNKSFVDHLAIVFIVDALKIDPEIKGNALTINLTRQQKDILNKIKASLN